MTKIILKDSCPITEKCYTNIANGTLIACIENDATHTKTLCLQINYAISNKLICLPNQYYDIKLDFVIDTNDVLFLGFTHCCLSNSSIYVHGGGRISINKNGEVYFLDNMSGHYKPSPESCLLIYSYFQKNFTTTSDCEYYLVDCVKTTPTQIYYDKIITQDLKIQNL
jgi:hypothetical protein